MASKWLQEKYIALLGSKLLRFTKVKDELWNCRCPYCGDSKRNQYKARGYIYRHSGTSYNFKCHNCNKSTTFEALLKMRDPTLFNKYRMESFTGGELLDNLEDTQKPAPLLPAAGWKYKLLPALHVPAAVQYLSERQIPHTHWDDIYYTENLNDLKSEFPEYRDTKFYREPRLVLPVLSQSQTLVGVITRALNKDTQLRYINMKVDDRHLIYGLNKVDATKRIMVFEGAFDSMFMPNSIAVDGAAFEKAFDYIQKDRDVLVYDNTPRNTALLKIMKGVIDNGWRVCIWPSTLPRRSPDGHEVKDINDMVRRLGYTPAQIENIITTNTFSGMECVLKFSDWKRR